MKTAILGVKGMHCKSCEMLIMDRLEDLGVESTASSEQSKVTVKFDESKVDLSQIKDEIKKEGFDVE